MKQWIETWDAQKGTVWDYHQYHHEYTCICDYECIITFSASPPPIFASLSNKEGVSTVPLVCKIKIIKSYTCIYHTPILTPSLPPSTPLTSPLAIILTFGITMEPLYSGHPSNKYKCPEYKGVLISEMI